MGQRFAGPFGSREKALQIAGRLSSPAPIKAREPGKPGKTAPKGQSLASRFLPTELSEHGNHKPVNSLA